MANSFASAMVRLVRGWTLSGDGTISQEMLRRYAPDYVSPEQYKAILSSQPGLPGVAQCGPIAAGGAGDGVSHLSVHAADGKQGGAAHWPR